jgi:hypothetical protein
MKGEAESGSSPFVSESAALVRDKHTSATEISAKVM